MNIFLKERYILAAEISMVIIRYAKSSSKKETDIRDIYLRKFSVRYELNLGLFLYL